MSVGSPTAGTWFSSQWRPDNEFETDTLRLLYHLPLRQAEGFLHALFGMMRLDLSAPDDTTLSRRSQHLRRRLRRVPPGEGLPLVLDSTALSIVGAGEWAAAKHGGRGRRGWRKLGLIRSRGHVPKGGYDVPNGSNHTSAVTPAIQ